MPRGESDDVLHAPAAPSWLEDEARIKAFELAWQRGDNPSIDDYLRGDGPARQHLLVELVHIDLEFRLKAGQPARVEAYLERYPSLAADRDAAAELMTAEWDWRRRAGET